MFPESKIKKRLIIPFPISQIKLSISIYNVNLESIKLIPPSKIINHLERLYETETQFLLWPYFQDL